MKMFHNFLSQIEALAASVFNSQYLFFGNLWVKYSLSYWKFITHTKTTVEFGARNFRYILVKPFTYMWREMEG